jgi:hypothetical protein
VDLALVGRGQLLRLRRLVEEDAEVEVVRVRRGGELGLRLLLPLQRGGRDRGARHAGVEPVVDIAVFASGVEHSNSAYMAAARVGLAGALVKCWNRWKGSASEVSSGRYSNGLGDGGAVNAAVAKSVLPAAVSSAQVNGFVTDDDSGGLAPVAVVLSSMKSCDGGGVMTSSITLVVV